MGKVLEFDPPRTHSGGRELTPGSCLLTPVAPQGTQAEPPRRFANSQGCAHKDSGDEYLFLSLCFLACRR